MKTTATKTIMTKAITTKITTTIGARCQVSRRPIIHVWALLTIGCEYLLEKCVFFLPLKKVLSIEARLEASG